MKKLLSLFAIVITFTLSACNDETIPGPYYASGRYDFKIYIEYPENTAATDVQISQDYVKVTTLFESKKVLLGKNIYMSAPTRKDIEAQATAIVLDAGNKISIDEIKALNLTEGTVVTYFSTNAGGQIPINDTKFKFAL